MHDDVDITSTNETFANNLNDIIVSIFDTGGDLATSTNLQRETVLRGAEARLSGWREVLFKGKKNKKGSIPFLSFGTKITNCAVSKGGLGGLTPPQRVFLVVCLVRKGLEKGAEPTRRAHFAGVNRAYLSVRSPMRDGSSDPQEEPDLLCVMGGPGLGASGAAQTNRCWFVAREANAYKAKGFSRQRVLCQ